MMELLARPSIQNSKNFVLIPESRVHVGEDVEEHGEGGPGHAEGEGDGLGPN